MLDDGVNRLSVWHRGTATYWPRRAAGEFVADVVIVGGGVLGITCAVELAFRRPDVEIAILEAKWPGFGSTGRAGGIIVNAPELPGSMLAHRSLVSFLQRHRIACEFWVEDGPLAGVPGEYDHDCLNPLAMVTGLAQCAAGCGANLYCDSPVTRVKSDALRAHVFGPVFQAAAQQVVFATGAYTPWLAGIALPMQLSFEPCVAVAIGNDELSRIPKTYYRQIGDDGGYVWGRRIPGMGFLYGGGERPWSVQGGPEPPIVPDVVDQMHAFLPLTRQAPILSIWSGLFGRLSDTSRRGLRQLDAFGRIHFAGGFDGVGLAPAVRSGIALAAWLARRIDAGHRATPTEGLQCS